MKNLFFLFILGASQYVNAQTPAPNTGTTPVPINPGQTSLPYNGTNPAGEPNQTATYTNTAPSNDQSKNNTFQPSVQPNPVTPITTPSLSTGTGTNPFHHLFQDPSRTPRDPKQVDPVRTADGSTGTHHRPKKATSGKSFANNKHHLKTAKPHDNAPEKPGSTSESTR